MQEVSITIPKDQSITAFGKQSDSCQDIHHRALMGSRKGEKDSGKTGDAILCKSCIFSMENILSVSPIDLHFIDMYANSSGMRHESRVANQKA